MDQSKIIKIGVGEYDTGWMNKESSLQEADTIINRYANLGADLVILPEMCATGFVMDVDVSEHMGEYICESLASSARRNNVFVLAGVALRRNEKCYNSAILIDPNGVICAGYDKNNLFEFAGEDHLFSPGKGHVRYKINGIWISFAICFDLRYPELFRAISPSIDACIVIANWPKSRVGHWSALMEARAIENQAYFLGVNRVGSGGGLEYESSSIAYSPGGSLIKGNVVVVSRDLVTEERLRFPCLNDLRDSVESEHIPAFSDGWTS